MMEKEYNKPFMTFFPFVVEDITNADPSYTSYTIDKGEMGENVTREEEGILD